jgi:MarR family transcriptional regulator, organic hydroperoxide resistance regulator
LKPEETIDYHLKCSWQSISNKYNQIASNFGITHAMGYILLCIEEEGTTVSNIAKQIGVKSTSLSRALNSLEDLKLIYKKSLGGDKRQVHVFLTEEGVFRKSTAKKVVREFNTYLDEHFSEEEKQTLIRLLNKINSITQSYSFA